MLATISSTPQSFISEPCTKAINYREEIKCPGNIATVTDEWTELQISSFVNINPISISYFINLQK